MTELIFRQRAPRRILSAMMEMALEEHPDSGAQSQIREAYVWLDDAIRSADHGLPPGGQLREALTTAAFPNYFNRTLSRAVMARYESRMGAWRDYTAQDTLPDYTVGTRHQFSEFDRPVERREKEEAYAGYIYEQDVRQIQVSDYAKQIDFSHRVLVNDDLGAFNNVAQKMADSTRRFLDIFVNGLYDNALTQAALIALGANYAGTGRLTTANLAIAYNAFVQRVDARGNPIAIAPRWLVIPPILGLTARQILESERIAELATNATNVLRTVGLQVREDPYIAFAAPNVPWYLMADPSDIPAVTVVKLQSKPADFYLYAKAPDKTPMTVTGGLGAPRWEDGSFLSGNIEFLVETTIGSRIDDPTGLVGIFNANGIYYSSGTTP